MVSIRPRSTTSRLLKVSGITAHCRLAADGFCTSINRRAWSPTIICLASMRAAAVAAVWARVVGAASRQQAVSSVQSGRLNLITFEQLVPGRKAHRAKVDLTIFKKLSNLNGAIFE